MGVGTPGYQSQLQTLLDCREKARYVWFADYVVHFHEHCDGINRVRHIAFPYVHQIFRL